MKKKILLLPALILALAFVLPGCKDDGNLPAEGEYSITLSDPALQLDVLDRVEITATVKNSAGDISDGEVVWTSSDRSVVTVSDGTVDALKAGTATVTATAEGKSAVCEITVSAILRPQLFITQTNLSLKEGKSSKISPSVKFKSRTLDNGEYGITYSYESSDKEIVSVTDSGNVTAIKNGEAEITVKADIPLAAAAGIDGELTKKIDVTVQPDYNLELEVRDNPDRELYLYAPDGTDYRESCEVFIKDGASLGGSEITEGWIYKSADASVANVSASGTVTLTDTAKAGDKVKVYAEYSDGAVTVRSNEIEFTVCKATVDKVTDTEIVIDLSAETPVIDAALFGDGFVITDVKDSEKPAVSLWSGGSVDKTAVTLLGERKLIVESEKINYRVGGWVVSEVITTAARIAELFSPQSGNAIPTVEGYYILGNDIQAGGAAFRYRGWSTADGTGLVGTFDGRGHKVDGLKINTSGGIFGVVSASGTVKNVSFTNVEIDSNGHAVILGYFIHGTVENVFISVSKLATTTTSSGSTAGLVSQVAGAAKLKDIAVVYDSAISANAGDFGALEAKSNVGAWENVYAVTQDKLFGGSATSGDQMSQYGKSVKKFASLYALWQDEDAREFIKSFGIITEEPAKPTVTVNVEEPLLANGGAAIEIADAAFTGEVSDVKIDGTAVTAGVTVAGGKLIFAAGTVEALMGADGLKSGAHTITLEVGGMPVTVNAIIAWTINTKAELDAMNNYLSFGTGNYNNNAGAKTSDGYFVLGGDVNFANSVVAGGWNGSKIKDCFFEGTFDGRGHSISNISIGNDGNKNTQMGLFGNLGSHGTVKNLSVKNVNVTGTCAAIAYLSYGKIENVYVKGTIKADFGNYGQYTSTSLLVGRFMSNAAGCISNVIVEAATAVDGDALKNSAVFGKIGAGSVTETIFDNCYAVNAGGVTVLTYGGTRNAKDFDGNKNKNFDTMNLLCRDETAKKLAEKLGVAVAA